MPIRVWALFSLRNPGWGTRKRVEVRWAGDPRDAAPEVSPLRHVADVVTVRPAVTPPPSPVPVAEEVSE